LTVLVTGASGFLGAAVTRALVERKNLVRVLIRTSSDKANLKGLNVETVLGDLRDRSSLELALSGCDGLYHVAADYRIWVPNPQHMYSVNVDGTRSLMEAAIKSKIKRIVYTSSVAVLGSADGLPADEDTPVTISDMIGHYKKSKYLAEQVVHEMISENGLPAVIVNPSTPVGTHDIKPTPTGRIIVDFLTGRMPAYVDTGLNIVHVDDCANGHILAYEKGKIGERYILGGEDMTLQSILYLLSQICDIRAPRIKLPHTALIPAAYLSELLSRLTGGDPRLTLDTLRMARKMMFFSSEKAKRELGYTYRPAVDGLKDAVAWFSDNGYT